MAQLFFFALLDPAQVPCPCKGSAFLLCRIFLCQSVSFSFENLLLYWSAGSNSSGSSPVLLWIYFSFLGHMNENSERQREKSFYLMPNSSLEVTPCISRGWCYDQWLSASSLSWKMADLTLVPSKTETEVWGNLAYWFEAVRFPLGSTGENLLLSMETTHNGQRVLTQECLAPRRRIKVAWGQRCSSTLSG